MSARTGRSRSYAKSWGKPEIYLFYYFSVDAIYVWIWALLICGFEMIRSKMSFQIDNITSVYLSKNYAYSFSLRSGVWIKIMIKKDCAVGWDQGFESPWTCELFAKREEWMSARTGRSRSYAKRWGNDKMKSSASLLADVPKQALLFSNSSSLVLPSKNWITCLVLALAASTEREQSRPTRLCFTEKWSCCLRWKILELYSSATPVMSGCGCACV